MLTFFFVAEDINKCERTAYVGEAGFRKRHGVMHKTDTIIEGETGIFLGSFGGNLRKSFGRIQYSVYTP